MARLLKKPLIIALAAVILLVIGFFAYIQNAFTGTRCEAAKHLDADMIGDCYGCHLKVTPQVAQDWYESKHGVTLVRCQVCHGQLATEGLHPDIVMLDPPRKGCDEATLSAVVRMAPRRVVYVSCNPATAARDAAWLEQNGYHTEKVQPVDLFPRTKHCECVIALSKGIGTASL